MVKKNVGGYGREGGMFYIKRVAEGGLHFEVVQEPYLLANPDDDATMQQRKRAEQKAKTHVLIKTEPIESEK